MAYSRIFRRIRCTILRRGLWPMLHLEASCRRRNTPERVRLPHNAARRRVISCHAFAAADTELDNSLDGSGSDGDSIDLDRVRSQFSSIRSQLQGAHDRRAWVSASACALPLN